MKENETHEILLDFETQTDRIISARRPDLRVISVNKKRKRSICQRRSIMDFAVPADNKLKIKESKKIDKYLDLVREQKKRDEENAGNDHTSW